VVIIDMVRADFIDKDVVETIEDFMLHAPLKNISVKLKRSQIKNHSFSSLLPGNKGNGITVVRTHEKKLILKDNY
jgi:hypothetical protein